MVGATFKGMCYMDGMCFAMLTPMYISPFIGRYVESYVAKALPMSQW